MATKFKQALLPNKIKKLDTDKYKKLYTERNSGTEWSELLDLVRLVRMSRASFRMAVCFLPHC